MSLFPETRYHGRRKFFALAGQVYLSRPDGSLAAYVKQKLFKLKEEVTVFADKAQSQPLLEIRARQIIDFSAAYDITEVASGRKLGALKRKGMKSIIKDEWLIMNEGDEVIAKLQESSGWGAFASRMINLIPQKYQIVDLEGRVLALIKQKFAFFVHKFDVDLSPIEGSPVSHDMAIGATILLLLIEGRQSR